MKNKTKYLPILTLICGLTGLALRMWLLNSGVDAKGLLITTHPANVASYLLTALFLLVLLLAVRPLNAVSSYKKLYPPSAFALVGCILAAAGIALSAVYEILQRRDLIAMLTLAVGLLAAVSLVLMGIGRKKGGRPNYLLHACLCVYLMLHLINQYRLWSSDPQLQLYFFPLLASVFLMLSAYHGTVLSSQKGSRRWYVFCNQAALFFCCLSLAGSAWFYYLLMGIFCLTNLCSLQVKPYRPKYLKEDA